MIITAMLCTLQSIAQSKNDYNWIITKQFDVTTPQAEGFHWRFTEDGLVRDYVETPDGVFRQLTTMSDRDGNLKFYSNGCAVFNAEHELMENGNGINDVSIEFDEFCPGGYPTANSFVSITDPGNEDGYYIIHKPIEELRTRELLYTYVDGSQNSGLGALIEKNEVIYDNNNILSSGLLNACKHDNGEDWWITQVLDSTNLWLTFLVDDEGISLQQSQEVGPVYLVTNPFSQAVYNRDGTKFAIISAEHDVTVYNFDNATGALTFDQQVMLNEQDPFQFSRGAMFSPNNRFLYVNTQREFYQIDMWEEDLQEGLELVDVWDGFEEETVGVPVVFGNMVHGPDCKIYMTTAAGIQYMHVIERPDEKGAACDFRQHSIRLDVPAPPFYSNTIPFFRMGEDAPCDPTLVGLADVYGVDEIPYRIYPNPVRDVALLDVEPEAEIVRYEIVTVSGLVVKSASVDDLQSIIDMSDLGSGMYFLRVYNVDGAWQVEKVVKE